MSHEEGWIGGSSIQLKCLSNNSTYGLYKLLNLEYDCSKGLEVKLKVKDDGNNKYNLLLNIKEGKQQKVAGSNKPVPNSNWTQVVFNI